MNYREVMSFLDNARVFGSILGLDTMRRLLFELHDPQKGLAAIHVAGTNGKGSTAAYLAGILERILEPFKPGIVKIENKTPIRA